MGSKAEIRKYINVIRRAVSLLEAELDRDDGTFDEVVAKIPQATQHQITQDATVVESVSHAPQEPVVQTVQQPVVDAAHKEARKKHIQDLMDIDCWPEAVPHFLVASTTDKDQKHRATSVMDMVLDRAIEGANFLDFGCGEGWTTLEAKKRGANAIGYDLISSPKWNDMNGPKFVTSLDDVGSDFDVVMLYDVLDHCMEPEELMSSIQSRLKKTGVVYVRCHPWTSRHATHLFKQGLNKAYMHMFLSWDEIYELTKQKPMFTRVEKDPIQAYRWWFKNFKIVKERMTKEPVSDFFKHPDFKTLLTNEQNLLNVDEFLKLMEIQFVDFILQHRQ